MSVIVWSDVSEAKMEGNKAGAEGMEMRGRAIFILSQQVSVKSSVSYTQGRKERGDERRRQEAEEREEGGRRGEARKRK